MVAFGIKLPITRVKSRNELAVVSGNLIQLLNRGLTLQAKMQI